MERTYHQRLRDILGMIDAIQGMVEGMDLDAYRADFRTRLAVERCVEIVSEASRHVPKSEKARFPHVPWPNIAGVGNVLRHEYQRVADEVIWRSATRSLPELRPALIAVIGGH